MDAVVQPKKAKAPKARRQQPDEEVRADAGEGDAAATRRTHLSCRHCAAPPLHPPAADPARASAASSASSAFCAGGRRRDASGFGDT